MFYYQSDVVICHLPLDKTRNIPDEVDMLENDLETIVPVDM